MTFNQLFEETIANVKERFKPTIKTIKFTIEHLIQEEYLKRDETNSEYLIYLE